MKIGIIRETKTPPDTRVCLPPKHCQWILNNYPSVEIFIQSSTNRCYTDEEYRAANCQVVDNVNHCDVLLGVKEVKIEALIPNKTYFFFSHTIKKQAYNRELLRQILQQNIRLIDYETLTDEQGKRVIAFGRWAGIVGAHNGILAWGKRKNTFALQSMHQSFDFTEAKSQYGDIDLKSIKVVLTGSGRVSNGSAEVLDEMGIQRLDPIAFLQYNGDEPVYCMLSTEYLFAKGEENKFDSEFYKDPSEYHSIIRPYLDKGNVLINGIYWDNKAPALFTLADIQEESFAIEVIADITCDIAPVASIPTTIKASTIKDPLFGFSKTNLDEAPLHQKDGIDMMTVDNLPNELPRDASNDFGQQFIDNVLDELLKTDSRMIYNASITTKDGQLNEPYFYLKDYVGE